MTASANIDKSVEMAKFKLRIARATNDLGRVSKMYSAGLGLNVLGSFSDHSGFDGVMLGHDSCDYHFEFTCERGTTAPAPNSAESLTVFYIPDPKQFESVRADMLSAGFRLVKSHNPYWEKYGYTFEDFEGYRVVICSRVWP